MSVNLPAGERLWSRDYSLTLLGTVAFFGSFFYLLSVLPDYVDSIGGAKWQIGLIVGGFSVVPLLIRPFVGQWSDSGRRKLLMRVGLISLVASFLLMALSEDIWSLFALRLVQGVGMAMFPTAAASLVAEVSPVPRRGEALGFFGMATGVAQMITPVVGVLIADAWGFDAVFMVSAVTAGLALLVVQPVAEPAVQRAADGEPSGALFPRAVLFPMGVFLTVTFAFTATASFLPLLGEERGLGNVGLFFFVAGAANIVTRPIAGRGSDRLGRTAVVAPGLLASAASMWLLAVAGTPATMWLAGVLLGAGLGATHTGLFALSLDRVAPSERGRATALFQLAWDLSGSVGGLTLGLIASGLDVGSVYWLSGLVVAAGLVALLGARTVRMSPARTSP